VSGAGAPEGVPDGRGLRLAIAASRWHDDLTEAMLVAALEAAKEIGTEPPTVVRVPGTFELPVVCAALAAEHDAVVALGIVVRGGTPHFDYVCNAVTDGCTRVALDSGKPVGFGVLTCDTYGQAKDRVGLPGSSESKGREAVLAAVETAVVLKGLRAPRGTTGF
jgi:6,7-dimethyl-8-ribityllumazine synthase